MIVLVVVDRDIPFVAVVAVVAVVARVGMIVLILHGVLVHCILRG